MMRRVNFFVIASPVEFACVRVSVRPAITFVVIAWQMSFRETTHVQLNHGMLQTQNYTSQIPDNFSAAPRYFRRRRPSFGFSRP